ncbi:MAG: hypothetical protein IJ532_03520 [Alphaproteobacteria bacterium]|nr:hypothetical protein [Alphaproteobacteria bacterium]
MNKLFITLSCLALSACYYAVPADTYYAEEYTEPNYYTQTTTYMAPSASHIYISEQRTYVQPDIVYINDMPPHHYRHSAHPRYYYPEHNHGKHPDYKIHRKVPSFSKNEKPIKIIEDKPKHSQPENKRHNNEHRN